MADRPSDRNTRNDTRVEPYSEPPTGTPRWVKVFGLVALVVLVLFVVVLLIGGGEHGPGRHSREGVSNTPAGQAGPPLGATHTEP